MSLMPADVVMEDMGEPVSEVARMVPSSGGASHIRRRSTFLSSSSGATSSTPSTRSSAGSERFPLSLVMDDVHGPTSRRCS